MTIGRNDPCHCDSGKKYKKCHLDADAAAGASPKLPDPRSMEPNVRQIRNALAPKKPAKRSASGVEAAQDIMYAAWEATNPRVRISLATKALDVSRDCADAYVLLASEGADTVEERLALYELGVAAGVRALGREAFKREVGHFWGILETRPFMRAKQGLAQTLLEIGRLDAAIEHLQEMLRLNPNDNQGNRYVLITCLLDAGRNDDLAKLFEESEDEGTAAWLYASALLAFRRTGDTPGSRGKLAEAVKTNPFVPAYLLGQKKLPRQLPDYVGFGDEREAIVYAHDNAKAWKNTSGALAWFSAAAARPAKKGRRPTTRA